MTFTLVEGLELEDLGPLQPKSLFDSKILNLWISSKFNSLII